MVFSDENKILIKSLYLKGYTAKTFTDKFPEKSWTKCSVNRLLKKLRDIGTVDVRLCAGLFVRICIWNVSRGAVNRSWQMRTALLAWSTLSFCFRSCRTLPLTLSSLQMKRCSRLLHLTVGRTTASTHPVTQGSAALSLSTCCVVARRSASRWWSQWPCQSSAVLHFFSLSQA